MSGEGTDRDDAPSDAAATIERRLGESEADELAAAIGDTIAENVAEEGNPERIVRTVGDRVTEKLDGDAADDVVTGTAELVLDTLPGVRRTVFVRRGIMHAVSGLSGRSEEVVRGVGDIVVDALVESGHAEQLVAESLDAALADAVEEGYTEDIVTAMLDEGVESLAGPDEE